MPRPWVRFSVAARMNLQPFGRGSASPLRRANLKETDSRAKSDLEPSQVGFNVVRKVLDCAGGARVADEHAATELHVRRFIQLVGHVDANVSTGGRVGALGNDGCGGDCRERESRFGKR